MEILSHSPLGYEGDLVSVEVDIRRGIPGIDLIGLPDNSVKESRDRIRTAIKNSQLDFPLERILINLAPGDLRKVGASFDLAIALAILQAHILVGKNQEFKKNTQDLRVLILGELHLDGHISRVNATLSAISLAKKHHINHCIIPRANFNEGRIIKDVAIWGVSELLEAFTILKDIFFSQEKLLSHSEKMEALQLHQQEDLSHDFRFIKGQGRLKRALEISAAGGHHTLLFGPPGSGKTLSARCFTSILPAMSEKEMIQTNRIWSLVGKLPLRERHYYSRPFRDPHHTASREGLLGGGGSVVLPGEISLAHNGVLFLDEATEFKRSLLQGLREPLEHKSIAIVRSGGILYQFPSNFQIIMAMNPCPCGNLGRTDGSCLCSLQEINTYWKRLGGALLDRIDIRIPLLAVEHQTLLGKEQEISSADLRKNILQARQRQEKRYSHIPHIQKNADLSPEFIEKFCPLEQDVHEQFLSFIKDKEISSRAVHSILKVALTILDLRQGNTLTLNDLLEATQHRRYGDNAHYFLQKEKNTPPETSKRDSLLKT